MKNYQRVNYKKYYAQNENGDYIEVSRQICFATAEEPTAENPYKQRWFYDEEAGYVVRLVRNEANDALHRFNSSFLKKDERYRNKKFACVWKDTSNCDQNCNSCSWKKTSRIVELDKNWTSSDGEMESVFTPVDETQDIFKIIAEKELTSQFLAAYEELSADDKKLVHSLIAKEKKKVIAEKLNITVDGVRYREQQLRKKLLSNDALKRFLEK